MLSRSISTQYIYIYRSINGDKYVEGKKNEEEEERNENKSNSFIGPDILYTLLPHGKLQFFYQKGFVLCVIAR